MSTPADMAAQQQAAELEWIQMRKDYADMHIETTSEKLARKLKENPLVPIGCAATLGALGYGLWSFRQGRRQMSQYMMRARIAAQGFTVIALIIGVGMTYTKKDGDGKK
ncbi:HIG1 domain family member 2A [Culex quinquefasciatus]|uniref:HIG1 domain family member 2A n=2 Tax=Culex pipiens complex TaxID=518105 RepID=B0WM78_CULQU|nr:HIG1 domain family member 2A, mitochondrial [Culex quinquefasciatus]XP_038104933.1 HIG1 domain family member 2A, mitochondrial [Culex quinquefasciatus]XP_039437883.1 HIG1 domain family member 2A, mitochondrial [Culex pipiens pallens]EDS30912.1 HIG1 domain family member 2A [Culex quinquefasciatus]|eukprot:XP_001849812.1 HIG1 domain family member 2A [Culex quinquefasciatus]